MTTRLNLDFSRLGRPTDNAFAESFIGSFRVECLNVNWFLSLDDARDKIEAWRQDYNEYRPHSSLDNLTPVDSLIHRHVLIASGITNGERSKLFSLFHRNEISHLWDSS